MFSIILLSCSSDREIKKITDKGFQIVVQKYLDEYDKEFGVVFEELSEAEINYKSNKMDSTLYITLEKANQSYLEFVTSEKNIKMIKSALEKKESLKSEQTEQLEQMLKGASQK